QISTAELAQRPRRLFWPRGLDPEAFAQVVPPTATHAKGAAVHKPDRVVSAAAEEKGIDAFDPHDRASMDADEARGIELLLECLNGFSDQELVFTDVQLGIGAARVDEVDAADGHDAH